MVVYHQEFPMPSLREVFTIREEVEKFSARFRVPRKKGWVMPFDADEDLIRQEAEKRGVKIVKGMGYPKLGSDDRIPFEADVIGDLEALHRWHEETKDSTEGVTLQQVWKGADVLVGKEG
jgi:hypothetical protein